MSTHAEIGIMHGDICKSIYVHSDGYLEYTGKVLAQHYDSVKAQYLVSQGDCSMLGKDIGEEIDFDSCMEYDTDNIATQCRFYRRDRKETGVDFKVSMSFEELQTGVDADYVYIMKDGVWYVSLSGGSLVLLTQVLATATVD